MSSEGSRTFVSLVFLTKNSRPEYDGKGHDPLSRMDRDSADVCRAGRPGHQQAVGFVLKITRSTPPQRIIRAANVVSISRLSVYPTGRAAQLMRVSWIAAVM
jgi:hypothetical protein